MDNLGIYIFVILALIVGIVVIKKVTSCMFRIAFAVIVAVILGVLYYLYC